MGLVQILVSRLHFYQQFAWQKGIDTAIFFTTFFNTGLKIHQPIVGNTKYPAQAIDEFLVEAGLVSSSGKIFGKFGGAFTDGVDV
ncbi:MAG: hypothetical protein KGZ69_16855 [Methylomonas sp.]|nr:hypothetical protein [Methylomonas sp.]